MNPYILVIYFGLATIFDVTYAFSMSTQETRKCKLTKVDRKLKARCHGMDLRDVPQYLTTGIEILDLSFNRIKQLKRTSFEKYTGIKYLVLYDNMIKSIEPGTFSSLTSLQEIDLSNNGLTTIPLEIFQLPSLRNLYVDDNSLLNLNRDLNSLEKPIRAPLEYLNVAKCELEQIPDLGILPNLWHINASMNPLTFTTLAQIAPMCHLKTVDLSETAIPNCACNSISDYFKFLGVKTYDFNCDSLDLSKENLCPDLTNETIHNENFQKCNEAIALMSTQKAWMYGGGGALAVIIFLLCCLGCILRSRALKVKKKNKLNERQQKLMSENYA